MTLLKDWSTTEVDVPSLDSYSLTLDTFGTRQLGLRVENIFGVVFEGNLTEVKAE